MTKAKLLKSKLRYEKMFKNVEEQKKQLEALRQETAILREEYDRLVVTCLMMGIDPN